MMLSKYTKQNIRVFFCVVLFAVLSLPLSTGAADDGKTVHINFFVDDDKDSAVRAMGIKFKELVAKQVGDKIQVSIHA